MEGHPHMLGSSGSTGVGGHQLVLLGGEVVGGFATVAPLAKGVDEARPFAPKQCLHDHRVIGTSRGWARAHTGCMPTLGVCWWSG